MLNRKPMAWIGVGMTSLLGVYVMARDRGPTPEEIAAGQALFEHEWTVNDALCGEGDGLGPVFNAHSCAACHSQGGLGGSGGLEHNVLTFEVDPDHDRDRTEVVTHVVHSSAIDDAYQETTQSVTDLFPIIPGGVRILAGCSFNLADHNPVTFQEVNSPALFGVGLLEEISDMSVVVHNAKRLRRDVANEFSGNYEHNETGFTRSHSGGKIGKFGWKGQFVTVEDFVASACAMELGLTNPHVAQPIPREHNEDVDAKLDMTETQLQQLVAFVKNLPQPVQILPTDPHQRTRAQQGERLFAELNCNDCHPKDVGSVEGVYTDFQLYSLERDDVGGSYGRREQVEIEFSRPNTVPLPEHWKTPALWGVADSAPYFHDGKSATLEEAILRHHGQAKHSRRLFLALPKDRQQMVIEFLETLRAPSNLQVATQSEGSKQEKSTTDNRFAN